mgnify:FL=1
MAGKAPTSPGQPAALSCTLLRSNGAVVFVCTSAGDSPECHRAVARAPWLLSSFRVLVCRACAQLLVSAAAESFEDAGSMAAVVEGVVRRWAEADAAAAAGRPCWWQLREAGMMAVFSCCEAGVVSWCPFGSGRAVMQVVLVHCRSMQGTGASFPHHDMYYMLGLHHSDVAGTDKVMQHPRVVP